MNGCFFARHPIDTRGLGKHKVILNEMENSTSMKDRFLIHVLKDVISYPQDDGKDEGTITESTGRGDNDEQSTDEYSDVNGNAAGQHNERSDEKSLSESDITIHTNAAGQDDKSTDDKSGKKCDQSMNENENAAGKCDEKTETVSKDDVTMAEDTPVQEGEGIINIILNGDGTAELTDVVDMSGKDLFTLDGTSYNIDNLDISQFTQIYLVNAPPFQMTQIKDSSIYQISVEVEDVDVKEEELDTGYEKAQDETIQKEKTVNPRSHDERKNTDGAESEHNEKDKDKVIQKEKTLNETSHAERKNTDGAESEHNEKDKDEVIQKEKTLNETSHAERKNTDGDESERDEKDKKEVENTDQNAIEVCGSTNLQKKNDDDKRKSDESDRDEKYKEGIEAENEVTVCGQKHVNTAEADGSESMDNNLVKVYNSPDVEHDVKEKSDVRDGKCLKKVTKGVTLQLIKALQRVIPLPYSN